MGNQLTITPCLWFDGQAEQAARFYVEVFPDSRITTISHYGEAGKEIHGQRPGDVMVVAFELQGNPFVALNGGPLFTFSEAVSFQVPCRSPEELDHYWGALSEGGDPSAQQCGWLKDRFGLSWQVFPEWLPKALEETGSTAAARVTEAMMAMKKLDWQALERARRG
ncbi:VOC family protein [Alloalcanivorax xenomutans]|uniref:VOC family protein n=1 Tax=Alloalcanivorax xenomutans TaxID=1094342 RepID=UPI003BA97FF6